VTLCGSGLLHEVGDWLGERESACPLMKDNAHECLEVHRQIGLGRGLLVSCWKMTWKYNLKMLFKGIWSPRGLKGGLEGGFNKCWLMTGAHGSCDHPLTDQKIMWRHDND